MTFNEIEDIVDGCAFLETEDGKLYEYISASVDLVKPINKYYFANVHDENDNLVFTYDALRKNKSLHVRY